MEVVLILLGALLAVGLPLWWLDRRNSSSVASGEETSTLADASDSAPAPSRAETPADGENNTEGECCGMHTTCERDSLLASVSPEIVYYDDEELDVYRGRAPEEYTEAEAEEFRDVLLTLLPDDIAGWARSLQLRDISLPMDVRDELLLIVAEERRKRSGDLRTAANT